MIISCFTDADLARMRKQFAGCHGENETRKIATHFTHLSDLALMQVAKGRIRFLSLAALIACWRRGIDVPL